MMALEAMMNVFFQGPRCDFFVGGPIKIRARFLWREALSYFFRQRPLPQLQYASLYISLLGMSKRITSTQLYFFHAWY